MKIEYDIFVERQFKPNFSGTKVSENIKDNLLTELNKATVFLDSEWDFCKYVFIPNTFGVKSATLPITLDIYPFIRTDYSARTENELPILTRFVQLPPGFNLPPANYIVAVLYSKEQLLKEETKTVFSNDFEWGIVSLMGTELPEPDPLVPITIMRNSLGLNEGGNGEPINKDVYNKSVEFWKNNILVK